jgi:hypothetical protein
MLQDPDGLPEEYFLMLQREKLEKCVRIESHVAFKAVLTCYRAVSMIQPEWSANR